jgi:hypothetical protein
MELDVTVIRKPFTPRDTLGKYAGILTYQLTILKSVHVGKSEYSLFQTQEMLELKDKAHEGFEALLASEITKKSQFSKITGFVEVNEKPCIPGSTMKGLIRSRLELLSTPINYSVNACFSQVSFSQTVSRCHQAIWSNSIKDERGFPCDRNQNDNVCAVCDLFGAPGLSSRVTFSDLLGNPSDVEIKTLNDKTALEVFKANTVLSGKIIFKSLKTLSELGLILIGLGVCCKKDGKITSVRVLIGRHKYSNLDMGEAKITLSGIEWFKKPSEWNPDLHQLMNQAVEECKKDYPDIANNACFSEAERREQLCH